MALKDLLVHIDSSPSCPARLDLAINLAQSHDAHLIGLYVIGLAPIHQFAEADLGPELIEAHDHYIRQAAEDAARMFASHTDRAGLAAEWRCVEGNVSDLVALNARYADFAILGQRNPERLDPGTAPELPGIIILDVGRPVLLVPHQGSFESVGKRVLVAWNASRGAARAVNDALPILQRADEVLILAVNPLSGITGHGDIPGADIALHLSRHGVNAEAQEIDVEKVSIGDMLLSRAADFEADLLVTGAFGRSRLRELVLGGVTRYLLGHMTIPVMMSR